MSFRKIEIPLPQHLGCTVVGFLYDSDDFADLGQDMVEVRVPGGITINAGWSPEGSPDGSYVIRTWGNVELPQVGTKDVDEALQAIRALVGKLTSSQPQPISDSFTTVHQERRYQVA